MAKVTEASADSTFGLVQRFRQHVHELPSSYCRRRFLDLKMFESDIRDTTSFVSKNVSDKDQQKIYSDRYSLLIRCIADPAGKIKTPFLYKAKDADAFTGGPVERTRALQATTKSS